MIVARGLAKQYGRQRVLDAVDLNIDQGERVALVGLNGAGKTTLIRCLLGLVPFEGDLRIAGYDVRKEGRAVRRSLGYVPQRAPYFDGRLSEVIAFFASLRGVAFEAVTARLTSLGLSLVEHGDKQMRELSGGMLQKVLLALALDGDTPVLLLDEPTANLDPRARAEFLRSLGPIDDQKTVVLASHRLTDVQAVAKRLIVLHGGSIVFDGSVAALWERVGATQTLWVRVPPEARDPLGERLRARFRQGMVVANGSALGIPVADGAGVDVLVELRESGIHVEDFWTESPSLQNVLEHLLGDNV